MEYFRYYYINNNIQMNRKWSDDERKEIIEYANTYSKAAAHRKYGVSTEAINYWTKKDHRDKILKTQKRVYRKTHINSLFSCHQMRDIKSVGLEESVRKYNISEKDYDRVVRCITRIDEYNKKNKERNYDRTKKWCEDNKEHVREYKKQYIDDNRDKIRKRVRKRKEADPAFKLKENIRRRMWGALKRNEKHANTEMLLGCSIQEFKVYLESKFTEGMSWYNYGSMWHVDHIKPLSLFDLYSNEQQKIAFHYTNCQPLLAQDNLKKSNKYG